MDRRTSALTFAAAACVMLLLAGVPAQGHSENVSASSHWLSLINMAHRDPSAMDVIIIPPMYVSYAGLVYERGWIGSTGPIEELASVRATVEAVEYWAWAIDQYATEYPNAQSIGFEVSVLGVDADAGDVSSADIVINTAMVADPSPFVFHLGVGLPSYPAAALWSGHGDQYMTKCTVWNTGMGTTGPIGPNSDALLRLRNLVIHEFGHCLAVGHTGTSLGLDHCSDHHGCFDQHPTDVMSNVVQDQRQCISNLNVQSLDEAYTPFATTSQWADHDEETFMKKTDYEQKCLPVSMHRF